MRSERDFVLLNGEKNIFKPIRKEVIEYFSKNKISWWGGSKPTGHVLSSQIACVNHLESLGYREFNFSVRDILGFVLEPNKYIKTHKNWVHSVQELDKAITHINDIYGVDEVKKIEK